MRLLITVIIYGRCAFYLMIWVALLFPFDRQGNQGIKRLTDVAGRAELSLQTHVHLLEALGWILGQAVWVCGAYLKGLLERKRS